VYQLKCRLVVLPAKKRDTTAFRAKIYGNSSALVELVRQF
jgi:hypothetical protein